MFRLGTVLALVSRKYSSVDVWVHREVNCAASSLLQGHVFSLGSTLSAALDFVIEPELEAELGEETQRLLEQMQEERPEDRPRPQVIKHICKASVCFTVRQKHVSL